MKEVREDMPAMMLRRNTRQLMIILLLIGLMAFSLSAVYAQDPTPTPEPTAEVDDPALPVDAVPTQPVQPNGVQLHIVQPGETLEGIAAAYGVEIDLLESASGLTGGVISPGSVLLIPVPVVEPDAPPDTAPEEPAIDAPPEEPAPNNGPVPGQPDDSAPPSDAPLAGPESGPGVICMTLFEDRNFNGTRDADEPLIRGGLLSLTGSASLSYSTDGISEPHCFANLTPGDYIALGDAPANFQLLTPRETPLTLMGGQQVNLEFAAISTIDPAAVAAAEDGAASQRQTLLIVGMIGVGVMLMLLGAAALIAVRNRGRRVVVDAENGEGDDDDDPPEPEPDVILDLKRD